MIFSDAVVVSLLFILFASANEYDESCTATITPTSTRVFVLIIFNHLMLSIGDLAKSTSSFIVRNLEVFKTKTRGDLKIISRLVPLTLPTSNSFYENAEELYSLKETLILQGILNDNDNCLALARG